MQQNQAARRQHLTTPPPSTSRTAIIANPGADGQLLPSAPSPDLGRDLSDDTWCGFSEQQQHLRYPGNSGPAGLPSDRRSDPAHRLRDQQISPWTAVTNPSLSPATDPGAGVEQRAPL